MISREDPRHRAVFEEACHRFAGIVDQLSEHLGEFDAATVAMVVGLNKSTLTAPELVAYLRRLADGIERTGQPPTMN